MTVCIRCRSRESDPYTDPDTGIDHCRVCGDWLVEAGPGRGRSPSRSFTDPLPEATPGRAIHWQGSWTRLPDGETWGLRIYLPDNPARDDLPEEGQKVMVYTKKGRVSLMELGPLVDQTEHVWRFAAPDRDKNKRRPRAKAMYPSYIIPTPTVAASPNPVHHSNLARLLGGKR